MIHINRKAVIEARRLHQAYRETVAEARSHLMPGKGIREFEEYGRLWDKAYAIEKELFRAHRDILLSLDIWPDPYDPRTRA